MSDKVKETAGHPGFPEHAIMVSSSSTDHDPICENLWVGCLCKWTARTCVCRWVEKEGLGWKGATERAQAGLGSAAIKHLMDMRYSR